jgi:hypothetical protein
MTMEYMKGQILDTGVTFVMSIVLIGILIGVGLITLNSFASSQTGVTAADNATKAGIYNSTAAMGNLSIQMPTIGTIMGVGLILLVVFTAFGYFMSKR